MTEQHVFIATSDNEALLFREAVAFITRSQNTDMARAYARSRRAGKLEGMIRMLDRNCAIPAIVSEFKEKSRGNYHDAARHIRQGIRRALIEEGINPQDLGLEIIPL